VRKGLPRKGLPMSTALPRRNGYRDEHRAALRSKSMA
jgi:hypothetical protein